MTYVKGFAPEVIGELQSGASKPEMQTVGFFGRLFGEVKDAITDVAGTGLETAKDWAKESIRADIWGRKKPDPTPQPGSAPEKEREQLAGLTGAAMPISVLLAGAGLLGFALIVKR